MDLIRSLVALLFFFAGLNVATEAATPPSTEKVSAMSQYQGVKVTESYQWLEDAESAKTKAWTEAQNKYARAWLDPLPSLPKIKKVLEAWSAATSPSYYGLNYRKGTLFALKLQPPKNQPLLVRLAASADPQTEHVILDPNQWNSKGTTAIDFFEPSLDGKFVAVSLSEDGSEVGTLHIFESGTGKEIGDQIEHINNPTAGGSVVWNHDGSGIFYTRYPASGERPKEDLGFFQQIYFHKIGTPTKQDDYVLGKEFPRIAEVKLSTSSDGAFILAEVANGDGGEFAHYLRLENGTWMELTRFSDEITRTHFGTHRDLYLLSKHGSPRGKILRLALSRPDLPTAIVVVPEGGGAITEFAPTDGRLYVASIVGGPSVLQSYDYKGGKATVVPIEPISDVSALAWISGENLLYQSQSYTSPMAWYRYEPNAHTQITKPVVTKPVKTKLATTSPVSFKDIEVVREFATSKDGTKVPLNIIYRKGMKRDGNNPTILYGYGGYGVNIAPRFRTSLYFWLEQGGVYVVANLRGGAEYGEDWHRAGRLTHKQNVFDDFVASGEALIQSRITNTKRLVIEGGSNGGLLMGAALTQRPDLFRVVISHVGIYDMLRVELDPNGAFNVTEFGTVKDPDQFKALYAYSPYHHVTDGTAYPACLLLTGAHDGRVNPFQSKKMTARLQASGTKLPILLRVSFSSGHGIGNSLEETISQQADIYAFTLDQLGMKY